MYKMVSTITGAILLLSCSAIPENGECKANNCKSMVVSTAVIPGKPNSGVIYALPTQLLEFTAQRMSINLSKLTEALKRTQTALIQQENLVNEKDAAVKSLEEQLKEAKSDAAKAKLGLQLEIARIELLTLKRTQNTRSIAVATAQQELDDFDPDDNSQQYDDRFELKPLAAIPDSSLRFSARLNKNARTSEVFEIKTTNTGLLSGGSGTSKGQVDELFVALVRAVSTLQTATDSSLTGIKRIRESIPTPNTSCAAGDGTTLNIQIDPYSGETGLQAVNKALQESKMCYRLELASSIGDKVTPSGSYEGLLYTSVATIQYQLFATNGGNTLEKVFYPVVIDSSVLGVLPMTKSAFADNQYEFEFSNGMLTRYKSDTPNPWLSVLGVIPEAGKALLSIPAELIQLKIDYSSKETGYYQAQQAAYEARINYEQSLIAAPASDATSLPGN